MKGIAHRVMLAWGLQRALIAVLAGAVGALALPPFEVLPALVLSLTPAVWLLDGAAAGPGRLSAATLRNAAWTGWCFGFGYFVAGLWWLGAAFLVEPDRFAWLMPLGVLGLPAGLALFPALGFAVARLLWSPGWRRVLAFGVGLTLSEWLRATVLTGFPWNDWGMTLGTHLVLAQAASVLGLHGLTLLAVCIGAAPATLADAPGPAARRVPLAAAAVLALLAAFGGLRLWFGHAGTVAGVKLRIVQPDIPQDDKFRPENRDAIMDRYLTLSDMATSPERSGVADVTHLVWPESAFPFILAREPQVLARIAALLPDGVTLVTGAVRMADPLPGERERRFYNAVQVVGHDGTVLDSADKVHLVPFGEYLPLSGLLTAAGLRQFVQVPGGFEAGAQRKALAVPGLPPVAPLVCYEAIFPGAVLPPDGRAGVLVNLTNDAWFGLTPGPYQHFAQARLRAVEEGLPLVRAANNGISAVVDPYGRVVASLGLGRVGVVDATLPGALKGTVYARFRDAAFWILLTMAALGAAVRTRDD